MSNKINLEVLFQSHPVIAILRGLTTDITKDVGALLYAGGIRAIEVPLNRPAAMECIRILLDSLPDDCLVGAGTVTTIEQVNKLHDMGATLVVSPNMSETVIELALGFEMHVFPGISSPTEAFAAYQAGARWLKLFPATSYGIIHLKALKSVLPTDVHIMAVGGINPDNIGEWTSAGVAGFGIGSDLFREGDGIDDVKQKLEKLNRAIFVK